MITTEELKVKLAEYGTAVKDLEEALAIEAASEKCTGAGVLHQPPQTPEESNLQEPTARINRRLCIP